MKVKVIKSSLKSYWYNDRIGEIFTVMEKNSYGYLVKEFESCKVAECYIDFCDCEVVLEESHTAALRKKLNPYFSKLPMSRAVQKRELEKVIKSIVRISKKY